MITYRPKPMIAMWTGRSKAIIKRETGAAR